MIEFKKVFPKSILQIIGINLVIYLFLCVCRYLPETTYEYVVRLFAIPTDISVVYKPWTILTSAFTHLTFIHIFGNMWALFVIAPYFKIAFNDSQIWLLYLAGHLFGIVCSIAINISFIDSHGIALGASCGVSCLIGALAFKYPKLPINLFFIDSNLKWLAILFIAQSVYMLFTPNAIGGLGHLFGMAFGMIYIHLNKNIKKVNI